MTVSRRYKVTRLGVAVAAMDVGTVGLVEEASVAVADIEVVDAEVTGSSVGVVGEALGEAIVEAIAVDGAAAAPLTNFLNYHHRPELAAAVHNSVGERGLRKSGLRS